MPIFLCKCDWGEDLGLGLLHSGIGSLTRYGWTAIFEVEPPIYTFSSNAPHSHAWHQQPYSVMSDSKMFAMPAGEKWYFRVLVCNSLFTKRDSILPYIFFELAICLSFLKLLYSASIGSSLTLCRSSLYILDTIPLSDCSPSGVSQWQRQSCVILWLMSDFATSLSSP